MHLWTGGNFYLETICFICLDIKNSYIVQTLQFESVIKIGKE